MTDLELARALETEILVENGIKGACDCVKYVMCPFPDSSWYYATLCRHDNVPGLWEITPSGVVERHFWWYDFTTRSMVGPIEFGAKYVDEFWVMEHEFLRTRTGTALYDIRPDGRVRRLAVSNVQIGGNRRMGMEAEWK